MAVEITPSPHFAISMTSILFDHSNFLLPRILDTAAFPAGPHMRAAHIFDAFIGVGVFPGNHHNIPEVADGRAFTDR